MGVQESCGAFSYTYFRHFGERLFNMPKPACWVKRDKRSGCLLLEKKYGIIKKEMMHPSILSL